MSMTLNRKRSFGTVYGHSQIGYEQDNQHFRHDGSLHTPEPEKIKGLVSPPTGDVIPSATATPDVLKAIEGLSSQIKDLKEPPGPDPARSEKARRIWAERRAREAEASHESPQTDSPRP